MHFVWFKLNNAMKLWEFSTRQSAIYYTLYILYKPQNCCIEYKICITIRKQHNLIGKYVYLNITICLCQFKIHKYIMTSQS